MAQKPKSQSINRKLTLKKKTHTQKNDTSKIDSIGFKTDTAENFFEKFALFHLVDLNQ